MHSHTKVLFILKYRAMYTDICFDEAETHSSYKHFNSGLLNSANQVHEMLLDHGVESKLVQVIDNNCIDKEVHQYKPTHVIIEALWCVPEKFEILQKLHPKVKWILRLHSETPFIANEGIAMEWILKYLKHKNMSVAANSARMLNDLKAIVEPKHHGKLMYLPNYYDPEKNKIHGCDHHHNNHDVIDIMCAGAIRPLKNQLLQAMASIQFARECGKKLRFHINGSRIENKGDTVIKNIRELFKGIDSTKYELVEHGWKTPYEFRKLLKSMDLAMQVSLTETFNITTADAVAQGVPIVVSEEVPFASCLFTVDDPLDINDIVQQMHKSYILGKLGLTYLNKLGLNKYNKHTLKAWLGYFK